MEMRALGSSDLDVSVLAFGTATFGGTSELARQVGGVGQREAASLIARCCDAGVNLFDTADIYSEGEAERMLGAALGSNRNRVMIATKASGRTGPGADSVGSSRRHLIEACEASLERLQTDRIDLYQLHGFDALVPLEETVRALDDLVQSGKVRHIGCSNFTGWQVMKGLCIAEKANCAKFVSQQIYYSLVGRDAEHELIPMSLDQQLGVLVWGPLASGFLAGKHERGKAYSSGTRLGAGVPGSTQLFDSTKAFDVLDAARDIAVARKASVSQVALNWLLSKPGVTTVILGARSVEQLRDNLEAISWHLSVDEIERLDKVGAPRLPYPVWHQRSVYQIERNPVPPARRNQDSIVPAGIGQEDRNKFKK
jgi:aryl-alcohol dehydrogenase-like predicted oxidoreductase